MLENLPGKEPEVVSPEETKRLRTEDYKRRQGIVAGYFGGPEKFKELADKEAAAQGEADARARRDLVLVID